MRTVLEGSCHCGNIEIRFSTEIPLDRLALRACTCSFCRRHGARTATDPDGEVRLRVRAPAQVSHYQFGLRTSEFLVCARCGTYVAAVMKEDGRTLATVNVNNLFHLRKRSRRAPSAYGGRWTETAPTGCGVDGSPSMVHRAQSGSRRPFTCGGLAFQR